MRTRPLLYGRLTWPEVAAAANEDRVCLIPVGTLEDHGTVTGTPFGVEGTSAERAESTE